MPVTAQSTKARSTQCCALYAPVLLVRFHTLHTPAAVAGLTHKQAQVLHPPALPHTRPMCTHSTQPQQHVSFCSCDAKRHHTQIQAVESSWGSKRLLLNPCQPCHGLCQGHALHACCMPDSSMDALAQVLTQPTILSRCLLIKPGRFLC